MTHLEFIKSKIYTTESIQSKLNVARLKNKKIVFTNGCFDILHQGHIDYLCKAADLGDLLVVAVNSDESVKSLGKGASRPIQDENSRALLIASLHFVQAVVIFNEETPLNLIKAIKPDVLVKGGDWQIEKIVGYDFVTACGGQVKTIDFLPGFSTTSIEARIKGIA